MLRIAILLASTLPAAAHDGRATPSGFWSDWSFEPGVVLGLTLAGTLYWLGITELKEAGVYGRAFKRSQARCFWLGFVCLVLALVSPIHTWGSALFSIHMTQHEIMMLAAAPLIVLGRPTLVYLKALPTQARLRVMRILDVKPLPFTARIATNACAAWVIHGAILWLWHVPPVFNATLTSKLVHSLQHLSFFGSALLFWWAVLDGHQKRLGYGIGILYLFTTAVHSSILGALLTFSRTIWYSNYATSTRAWGLSPLEDQQIGGLIMWIPASVAYVVAALTLFVNWLRESDRRSETAVLKESFVS